MAKLVSKTYGDGLFDTALESESVDRIFEETKIILSILHNEEQFIRLLNHPKISRADKVKLIEDIFTDRVSPDMVGFLVLAVNKNRTKDLSDILEYLLNRIKEYKNIGIAYVITAVELTGSQMKAIKDKLLSTTKYVEFEMKYQVDPSLIGGMVIRVNDRVVDSSIKGKLSSISGSLHLVK